MAANSSLSKTQAFQLAALGRLIREKRELNNLTLEQAHEQSGISAATLSRLERLNTGRGQVRIVPSTATLVAIANWLEVPLNHFLDVVPQHQSSENTPDLVEAHLRADRKLNPEAQEALGKLFRAAYDQFAKLGTSDSDDHRDGSS